MLQTFKSEWKPNLVGGLTPRLPAPCIGQTSDPASECEFLVCVVQRVMCNVRSVHMYIRIYVRKSSVILLDSLN